MREVHSPSCYYGRICIRGSWGYPLRRSNRLHLQPLRDAPHSHPAFPLQTQGDSYGPAQGPPPLTGFGLPASFGPIPTRSATTPPDWGWMTPITDHCSPPQFLAPTAPDLRRRTLGLAFPAELRCPPRSPRAPPVASLPCRRTAARRPALPGQPACRQRRSPQ